jgi:hypothetical protein
MVGPEAGSADRLLRKISGCIEKTISDYTEIIIYRIYSFTLFCMNYRENVANSGYFPDSSDLPAGRGETGCRLSYRHGNRPPVQKSFRTDGLKMSFL